MRIIKEHNILKGFFGIRLCWYLILKKLVSKSLKFGPKMAFSLYFVRHFYVTIATVKVK